MLSAFKSKTLDRRHSCKGHRPLTRFLKRKALVPWCPRFGAGENLPRAEPLNPRVFTLDPLFKRTPCPFKKRVKGLSPLGQGGHKCPSFLKSGSRVSDPWVKGSALVKGLRPLCG